MGYSQIGVDGCPSFQTMGNASDNINSVMQNWGVFSSEKRDLPEVRNV